MKSLLGKLPKRTRLFEMRVQGKREVSLVKIRGLGKKELQNRRQRERKAG